jgi:hypothetical protein
MNKLISVIFDWVTKGNSVSAFVMWVWLTAIWISVGNAQTVSYEVSSTPTELNNSGEYEVMGEVRITKASVNGTPQTTQASTISFLYSGVAIKNTFIGLLPVNLGTGVIADTGGITVTLSGGFVSSGVAAQVINQVTPTGTNGILILNIPGGLIIGQGDSIRVNGVQTDATRLSPSLDLLCFLQANPSSAHSFNNVSFVRVGRVVDKNPLIITLSPLLEGVAANNYTLEFTGTGGAPPYTWHLVDGILPIGLSLDKITGVLSGAPAVGGFFQFTIKIIDSLNASSTKAFALDVRNILVSAAGLDFGQVPYGQSGTRTVTVTNQGRLPVQIVTGIVGSSAYRFAPANFTLEGGTVQEVTLTFAPQAGDGGNPFLATVSFAIPNITRLVNLYGLAVRGSAVTVESVLPQSGSTVGNTRLRVQGANFIAGTTVTVGGVPLRELNLVNDHVLTGITGPHAAGSVDIVVSTAGGGSAALPSAYIYRELPTVVPVDGALRIPYAVDNDQFRTNLGINNLGQHSADVDILMVDNNGLLLAQRSMTVPPEGLRQINNILRYLEGSTSVTGREVSLILDSKQPIAAWVSQIDMVSIDPSFLLADAGGSSRLLVPSSVASARFATSLMLLNTVGKAGRVNVRVRSSSGEEMFRLSDLMVPGNGFFIVDDLYKGAGIPIGYGPVEIEALDGITLIGVARVFSREHTGAYFQGVEPLVSDTGGKWRINLPYVVDSIEVRSNLGLTNPGSSPTTVSVSLIRPEGVPGGTVNMEVPPFGLVQINNIVRVLTGSSGVTGQEGWLRVESDQPVVAWTAQIDNLSQDGDFAIGQTLGATSWLIPSSVSTVDFKSSLVIVNLDPTAASVEVRAKDVDGLVVGSSTFTLPGNGLLKFSSIRDALGLPGSFGPLEVFSADQRPLLVSSRAYTQQRTGGAFAGLPLRP